MFMPKKYYPTSIIQINSQNKMFKNFISANKLFKPEITSIESFTLASVLAIPPIGNPFVFDLPNLRGNSLASIDSLFQYKPTSFKNK